MTPQTGPFWQKIDDCDSNILHEKETIAFCKEMLIKGMPHGQQKITEEIYQHAQRILSQAEEERRAWIQKHYEWERESA